MALVVNNLSADAGDSRDVGLMPVQGSVLGSGTSPRGGNGNPLPYPCLENSMHREALSAAVPGVTKSQRPQHTQNRSSRVEDACRRERNFPPSP